MKNKKKFLLIIIGLLLIVLSFIIDKIDSYDKNYSYLSLSEYIVDNHFKLLEDEEYFKNNNLEINNIKNDNCIKKGKYE